MSIPFLEGVEPTDAPNPEPVVPNHHASEDTNGRIPSPIRRLRDRNSPNNIKPPRREKSAPPYKEGEYTEALVEFYNLVALVAMPFKPALAMTIMGPHKPPTDDNPTPMSVAENCALAWDKAAKQSPTVRRMLAGFTATTVWGVLAAAHAPIIASMVEGTPLAEKLNPAAAMEAFLKRNAENVAE